LTLLPIFLVSACGSDPGFIPQPAPSGFLRVVNTVSDSPLLIVDYELQRIGTVNFGNSTGVDRVLPEVTRELKFSFNTNGVLTLLASELVRIEVDHLTTAVISGTMAAPEIIIIDNAPNTFDETTTIAELRFVHGASNITSDVDFHVTADDAAAGAPLATVAANTASSLIPFESLSNSRLRVFNPGNTVPLWDSGSFVTNAATRPLYVLLDYFGPGDAIVRSISIGLAGSLIFPNEVLPGAVSFSNMISDRGPVDVYLDNVLQAEDLLFGDVGDYIELAGREYEYKLTTANVIDEVIVESSVTLINGIFQTIAATGIDETNATLFTVDDLRRVANRATFSTVHSAPSLGTVDVYVLPPGESVSNNFPVLVQLQFGGDTTLNLFEGTYDLFVTESTTKTIVLGPERINVNANAIYRINLADAIGGGEPAQIIFGYDFDPGFNP
jgi:hypothetical protein